MFNWIDITVKQEQYRDLLRQAEKERFIRELLRGRQRRFRFSSYATHLITWLLG